MGSMSVIIRWILTGHKALAVDDTRTRIVAGHEVIFNTTPLSMIATPMPVPSSPYLQPEVALTVEATRSGKPAAALWEVDQSAKC
jgi:hypothetical protein